MKRLIATEERVYDAKGKYLGLIVAEVEAFTAEELRPTQCVECGGPNGNHREYFVKTGQSGLGEVDGYYRRCSQMKSAA